MTELLRFATAGSVDDGKSTLIGRLLLDTKQIFEDQLEAVERTQPRPRASTTRTSRCSPTACAPSASRASPSTWRTATSRRRGASSSSPTRPGHVQYTRNMVTGASTADLALVLIDARKGVLEQSRRHAVIASLLQVKHLVLCVNKMDLVDYSQERFDEICDEFTEFAAKLDIDDLTFIPVSALHGDNVTRHSPNMPWYEGPTLLHHLEHVYIGVRPQPHRRAVPGAVRDPADEPRPPRLPRLRGPGRERHRSARATRWSCCRAASPRRSPASTSTAARSRRRSRRCR